MDRRKFLGSMLFAGGTFITTGHLKAEDLKDDTSEFNAILVDTTICEGCRACEEACAEAHDKPAPDIYDESVLEKKRDTSTTQWTVINSYETDDGEVFRKSQCMHCAEPACAAACVTKAMIKTEQGPVIWRANKCMGCRYCMVACPFDVPKFEYGKAIPTIQKCNMCWDRLQENQIPACVENCPAEALTFGKKSDMLKEASKRIVENPDTYNPNIYGQYDAGGTCYLYLASVPFDQLGMNVKLGSMAFPDYTKEFLYSVPFIELLWPAILYGIYKARTMNTDEEAKHE